MTAASERDIAGFGVSRPAAPVGHRRGGVRSAEPARGMDNIAPLAAHAASEARRLFSVCGRGRRLITEAATVRRPNARVSGLRPSVQ